VPLIEIRQFAARIRGEFRRFPIAAQIRHIHGELFGTHRRDGAHSGLPGGIDRGEHGKTCALHRFEGFAAEGQRHLLFLVGRYSVLPSFGVREWGNGSSRTIGGAGALRFTRGDLGRFGGCEPWRCSGVRHGCARCAGRHENSEVRIRHCRLEGGERWPKLFSRREPFRGHREREDSASLARVVLGGSGVADLAALLRI